MVLDVPVTAEDHDEDVLPTVLSPGALDNNGFSFGDPRRRGLGPLHITHLLQMILQDAQTRLFFKAQTLVQTEIRYYVPKGDDLAYPDKLTGEGRPSELCEC